MTFLLSVECKACLAVKDANWVYLASLAKSERVICEECRIRLNREIADRMIDSYIKRAKGY